MESCCSITDLSLTEPVTDDCVVDIDVIVLLRDIGRWCDTSALGTVKKEGDDEEEVVAVDEVEEDVEDDDDDDE